MEGRGLSEDRRTTRSSTGIPPVSRRTGPADSRPPVSPLPCKPVMSFPCQNKSPWVFFCGWNTVARQKYSNTEMLFSESVATASGLLSDNLNAVMIPSFSEKAGLQNTPAIRCSQQLVF